MVAYGNRFVVFGGLTSILPVNDVWLVEFRTCILVVGQSVSE